MSLRVPGLGLCVRGVSRSDCQLLDLRIRFASRLDTIFAADSQQQKSPDVTAFFYLRAGKTFKVSARNARGDLEGLRNELRIHCTKSRDIPGRPWHFEWLDQACVSALYREVTSHG
jgi:hypothetical protein